MTGRNWQRSFVFLFVMLLPLSIFASSVTNGLSRAAAGTITVPDDYAKIQDAVDAASVGDTIFVRSGIYYENLVVNKTVSLIGENRTRTIIDGNGTTVVRITASNVSVSGFTVQGASEEWESAIVLGTWHCNIIENNITANYYGIYLQSARYCNIAYNAFASDFCAVFLFSSSDKNRVIGNSIVKNWEGIVVDGSSNNDISGNNITANSVGIDLFDYFSSYNCISGNNITDNDFAISLERAFNTYIIGNNISNNGDGITARLADSNIIHGNNIVSNTYSGIYLDLAEKNAFYQNNFVDNGQHVHISNNGAANNTWDNGYPSGGNYWSGYNITDIWRGPYQNETGSDGIGDMPYVIDGDNVDRYPLMNPYVRVLGDVDFNGIVNMLDLYPIAIHFGASFGDLEYYICCDVNNDNTIDMLDLYTAAIHFGETYHP